MFCTFELELAEVAAAAAGRALKFDFSMHCWAQNWVWGSDQ